MLHHLGHLPVRQEPGSGDSRRGSLAHVNRANLTRPQVHVLEEMSVQRLEVVQVKGLRHRPRQQLERAGLHEVVLAPVQLVPSLRADEVAQDASRRIQIAVPALLNVTDYPRPVSRHTAPWRAPPARQW